MPGECQFSVLQHCGGCDIGRSGAASKIEEVCYSGVLTA
jgi:hypothetical protein